MRVGESSNQNVFSFVFFYTILKCLCIFLFTFGGSLGGVGPCGNMCGGEFV